jgi:putative signal transducing protein
MNPVTVFTAFSSPEAQLVRARLDAAGFHPFVINEFEATSMFGSSSNPGFPVFVQVPSEEADEVKAFLAADDDTPSE